MILHLDELRTKLLRMFVGYPLAIRVYLINLTSLLNSLESEQVFHARYRRQFTRLDLYCFGT